jgi:DNA-directed RNA polymerase specialized sigma24 family protein
MSGAVGKREGWPEEDILEGLDLRDHEGLTYGQIAKRLDRTRNAVIATLRGVDAQADKHDPDGIQNGTMPRGWWRR